MPSLDNLRESASSDGDNEGDDGIDDEELVASPFGDKRWFTKKIADKFDICGEDSDDELEEVGQSVGAGVDTTATALDVDGATEVDVASAEEGPGPLADDGQSDDVDMAEVGEGE
ncbi:hypothetical protein HK097_007737 [Rhizophlyctis rosea]|uniref:Uncharacterized protein n=1 Tax=Rhizophlyctis rosea TaxID=64517 RepID=A0AAD5SEB5_9FUNG|nr:hypothetical protein HK097_007737 [Rhizophlyctis rosea]